MIRFVVELANGLACLTWADTNKQAEQNARNLAAYHGSAVLYIVREK